MDTGERHRSPAPAFTRGWVECFSQTEQFELEHLHARQRELLFSIPGRVYAYSELLRYDNWVTPCFELVGYLYQTRFPKKTLKHGN